VRSGVHTQSQSIPVTTRGVSTHSVFGASRSSSKVTGTNFSIGVHKNCCQNDGNFDGPSWGRNEEFMLVWSTRVPDTTWLDDTDEADTSWLLNENVRDVATVDTWEGCVDKTANDEGDAIGADEVGDNAEPRLSSARPL
jgi:hypothetical protein